MDFPKYPRMLRLPVWLRVPRKRYATDAQVRELISEPLFITEKVDGSIIRSGLGSDGVPVVRGRRRLIPQDDTSKPYRGLWGWVWGNHAKLEALGGAVFVEWLMARHTVPYDRLPDWGLVFDIYDTKRGTFLPWNQSRALVQRSGLHSVPTLFEGRVKSPRELYRLCATLANAKSHFSDSPVEGVVVKNYARQIFMKHVRREFDIDLESSPHWLKQPLIANRLAARREG